MPALTDQQLIRKFNIKSSDKILDIGGGSKQHDLIQIHTLVDILPPQKAPYGFASSLSAKNFVQLNIETEPLPFKNKEFDFVFCTHTLEDLHHPFLVIKEMSRVARRGYISTPARGLDLVFKPFDITTWLTGPVRVPGFPHHYWLFENKNKTLHITPKNFPLLYSSEFHYLRWSGPEECQYYWEDEIKYHYDPLININLHLLINNYRHFIKKNRPFLKKGTPLIFLDHPFIIIKAYLKLLLKRGLGFQT